jgi:hypothetical protein
MPDEEELNCAPSKRKTITWMHNAWLNSLGHLTGFSTSEDFNKANVIQDWISINCKSLGLPIPHLAVFKHHECPCKRFAIDDLGDHLHSCTQHVGATMGAHTHYPAEVVPQGWIQNRSQERATQLRTEEGRPLD